MEFQYQLQPSVSYIKGPDTALPFQVIYGLINITVSRYSSLLFQVHVYVFEGRQLEGGTHICPAATITCHNKSLSTVAKPETSSPVFNEV